MVNQTHAVFTPDADLALREMLSKIKAPKEAWSKVPAPSLKGNITLALCSVSEFAKAKDYPAALLTMFELLQQNAELLQFHPASLQVPESAPDPKEQTQASQVKLVQLLLRLV